MDIKFQNMNHNNLRYFKREIIYSNKLQIKTRYGIINVQVTGTTCLKNNEKNAARRCN